MEGRSLRNPLVDDGLIEDERVSSTALSRCVEDAVRGASGGTPGRIDCSTAKSLADIGLIVLEEMRVASEEERYQCRRGKHGRDGKERCQRRFAVASDL